MFVQWLSAIPFSGGGFNDVAVAEGLAEALMMFSSLNGSQPLQKVDGKRHCILIAASNPYSLPTPVYCPAMRNLEQSGNIEAHTSNQLADAATVAKAFPQCSVSLSVICPRKLPKLRAIYNAGKSDPQAADPPVDTSKNPNFLVLISENFSEACAAFSRTEMASLAPNQILVEMDVSSVPPVSGPAAASNPSVMNQQSISAGNIPAATVNIEPTMVTSISGPAPPHNPTARPTSQLFASLQSASPISVSEEMVLNNENIMETTPIVSEMTESLHPFSGAAANDRIWNGVASAIPAAPAVFSPGKLGVTSMTGLVPLAGTGQRAQNSVPASLALMVPSMFGNSNLCMSQPLSNIQGGIGADSQTTPVLSQGNQPESQMMQSGMGMHQNVPSGVGTGMPLGIGTMMPTPGMTQQGQPGMLPLGRNKSTEANMSLSQQQTSATLPSAQSNYVKFWEGKLYGQRQGETVLITRLKGFRSASASESLAANWPPTLQIVRLITEEHMNNNVRQRTGKADLLIFWAMDRQVLLNQMQEKKSYAVVRLPSHTMFLSVSDKTYRLIGMLYPRENVEFKTKIPNQQLQAQHPWLEQQLQQRHCLQLRQHQPLSLLQQQQPLQPLPQQQPPSPLKLQHNVPLQQQSEVPRIHRQQTPQTQQIAQMQQIEQQQPIIGMAVNQAYMQGTGRSQLVSQTEASSRGLPSIAEDAMYIEHDNELDN